VLILPDIDEPQLTRQSQIGAQRRALAIGPGEWRASFHSHPMTSADGFGVAPTAWRAVQRAASSALNTARQREHHRQDDDQQR